MVYAFRRCESVKIIAFYLLELALPSLLSVTHIQRGHNWFDDLPWLHYDISHAFHVMCVEIISQNYSNYKLRFY